MSEFPRKLSIVLLFAVLGLCIYRARTQSFTVDEAWVFQLYIHKPLAEMARHYDASNHVLHTLAMKLCRWLLGTGELALRAPTLVGAAMYFRAVYLLTRLLFRSWMQFFAVALLVLHPLVLDFFVAARGYGLALSFFTWSLYFVVCYFTKGLDRSRLSMAGIFAGLAIASNITLLLPSAALGIVLIAMLWREDRLRAVWSAIDGYGGPAVVIALLFLILPVLLMNRDHFYFGTQGLVFTSHSLVEAVVKNGSRPFSDPLLAAINPVGFYVVPAVFWVLAAASSVVAVRYIRATSTNFRLAPFVVVAGTLGLSVGLAWMAHLLAGTPYPLHRTGLYLIPLFTLAVLLGGRLLQWRPVVIALSAVVTVVYVSQIENRYFVIWRFDASMSKLMRALHEDQIASSTTQPVRVAASGVVSRSAFYYKVRRHMHWLSVVETPTVADADYYILTGDDRELASSMNLRVLDDDGLSGTLLAKRVQ